MKLIFKAAIIVIIVLYGCKDSIVESVEPAKINFQEGTIEGIKTGDDTTTVQKILGRPDGIAMGDFDGFIYEYMNKYYPGIDVLTVTFYNRMYGLKPEDYRVTVISVMKYYTGKSKEGIGIGSTKTDVIKTIGFPFAVYDFGENYRFPLSEKKVVSVLISYNAELRVVHISVETLIN